MYYACYGRIPLEGTSGLKPGIHCTIFKILFLIPAHTVRVNRLRCAAKAHDLCAHTVRSDHQARSESSHCTGENGSSAPADCPARWQLSIKIHLKAPICSGSAIAVNEAGQVVCFDDLRYTVCWNVQKEEASEHMHSQMAWETWTVWLVHITTELEVSRLQPGAPSVCVCVVPHLAR